MYYTILFYRYNVHKKQQNYTIEYYVLNNIATKMAILFIYTRAYNREYIGNKFHCGYHILHAKNDKLKSTILAAVKISVNYFGN